MAMPAGSWTANVARAVHHNGSTYIGLVDCDGNARVAKHDHATGAITMSPAIISGLTPDIHSAPSVLIRQSDSKLLLSACQPIGTAIYVALSTNAEDVSAWGAATNIAATLGATNYTYPNLVQLSGESGKIYLFYKDLPSNSRLCYSTSTDGGSTWAAQTTLFAAPTGKNGYFTLDTDDTSKIHFVVADGTAPNGDTASLYHFYYDGAFKKSDGTAIVAAQPYGTGDVTKLFDGATNGTVRQPLIPVITATGLVVTWAAYDPAGTGQPEKYWYGKLASGVWSTHSFDTTGSTPNATIFGTGATAIDRADTSQVYVSKYVSTRWQMHIYSTSDGGTTWSNSQLTTDAAYDQQNILPVVPRGDTADPTCLWLFIPTNATPPSGSLGGNCAAIRSYPNPIAPF